MHHRSECGKYRRWGSVIPRLTHGREIMHNPHSKQKFHFCFRVITNGIQHQETDALAFSNLEEVWHEGALSSCEIIREMQGRIEPGLDWRMDVADTEGNVIYRFSFLAETL
jgi:hypothetical protein